MWGVTKTRNALDEFKGPTVRIYVFVFKEPVGAITKFYTDDACTVLLGAVAVEEPPGGALMDHDDPVRYDRAARGLITEEDEG
jgi:hypothetical protein